jgi:hypothetical protein
LNWILKDKQGFTKHQKEKRSQAWGALPSIKKRKGVRHGGEAYNPSIQDAKAEGS